MDITNRIWKLKCVLLLCQLVYSASNDNVFDIEPINRVDALQERTAILRCSLKKEFKDTYNLTWLADGKEVQKGRRYVGSDGNLHFESVDKELDSGQFQCLATKNSNPRDEHVTDPVTLNIKWLDVDSVSAKFPSENTDILPGSRVVLRCNVTGNPKPKKEDITWRINEMNIDDLSDLAEHFEINKFRLTIKGVELVLFDGIYSCCASTSSTGSEVKCSRSNYKLHVRDVSVPVLISPPQNAIVKQNGQASFTCRFDSTPPSKIEWLREGQSIRPKRDDSRISVYSNGTMIIKNVKEKNIGEYTCMAKGSKGNTTSASATLGIAYIDGFSSSENEEEYLDIGNDLEKVCGAPDALPPAQITWMKNKSKIGQSSNRRVTVLKQTLVIQDIQASDEGQYQCVASNMAGNVTKTFTFLIKSTPKMQSELVARTEQEGSDVILKCLVDAVPEPSYIWHQNLTRLKSDNHFKITGNQLTINSISIKDAAKYKCTAQNDQGEVSSSAFIGVDEQLKFDPRPSDTCAEIGKRVEIVCGARGVKNPTVDWTVSSKSKNYEIITNGHGESTKTLVFLNPRPGETWKAYCTATASDTDETSVQITVSVGRKPKIVTPPQTATVFRGTAVRLDCGIDPAVKLNLTKLRWTVLTSNKTKEYTVKNNSDGTQYIVMNNGSFYIKNASSADTAIYSCSYKDCGSEVQAKATLDVAVPDGPIATPNEPGEESDKDSTPQYKKIQTVALAVGSSVAYLILTITIIVYCRRKKRHRKNKANTSVEAGDDIESDSEKKLMLNGSSKQANGHTAKNGILLEPVTHLNEDIENLQYDSAKLDKVTVIGHGEFGEIFLSKAPGLFPDLTEDILVMVKQLEQEQPSEKQENHSANNANASIGEMAVKKSRRLEFNREIRLLYLAKHENVVRLLGVCSKHTNSAINPDHLITEYLEWGILKLCLQASKEGKLQRFNKHMKMKMCCQIAAGLDHLTKLGVAHQDVATRNCVISSKMLIKLSVLSLTKEGFENEYSMHYGRLSPIRWTAPEILHEDKIDLKSDVWSFGVTCWEIFTLGTMPYSDLSDEMFLEEMTGDHPPTLPPLDNSKRITSLISKCCQQSPNSRPEFYQIVKKLQSILGLEAKVNENDATSATSPNETDVDADGPLLSSAPDGAKTLEDIATEVRT